MAVFKTLKLPGEDYQPRHIEEKDGYAKNYRCSLCGKRLRNERGLRYHLMAIHNKKFDEYFVETYFNGEYLKCGCGCGRKIILEEPIEKTKKILDEYLDNQKMKKMEKEINYDGWRK